MKLIRLRHFSINYINAAHFFSTAEILRYIPGNVWGLGARVMKGPRYGIPQEHAGLLLIEETALLLCSVSVLSGVGVLCITGINPLWKILGVILILSFLLIFILPFIIKKGLGVLSKLFSLVFSVSDISLRSLFRVLPIYFLLWISYALSNAFLFYGIFSSTDNTFFLIMVFSVLAWFIGYASLITPSGLGVREFIFSIGLIERITSIFASLFSLLSRVWLTILELIFFGVIVLLYKKPIHEKPIKRIS
jgi:hypothetical protein